MKKNLTVREVASLKGCTERYIRQIIADGVLQAAVMPREDTGQAQYLIAVEDLPAELQRKYFDMNAPAAAPLMPRPAPGERKPLDSYSADEREQIGLWTEICKGWLARRLTAKDKAAAMTRYLRDTEMRYAVKLDKLGINLSPGILYRKLKAYREDDLDGLIDKRGKANKGRNQIDPDIWDAFLYYWLDDRQPSVTLCYNALKTYLKEFSQAFTESAIAALPTERTFRRHLDTDVTESMKILAREGEKAFMDRCAPYIERLYDELQSNDYWIADNHTFDIITQRDGDEKGYRRMHITTFQDARSGIITGWNVTDNPCSQSTLIALRHGITRFGIPRAIYVDNGSEFLCRDIGGRGHRKRNSQKYEDDPPTILARLGIEMRNALVRNAKAKPIERTFRTLKEQISKLYESYCGGTILERPESLKYKMKKGIVTPEAKLREDLNTLIDGIYNAGEYGGRVRSDRGKTRLEVWSEHITALRKASREDLTLMLMRSTRPVKVGRNGVYLSVCGEKLHYWDDSTKDLYGKSVYLRYDPDDLSSVRLYEAETDKYICTTKMALDTALLFADDPEEVRVAQNKVRSVVKQSKKDLTGQLSRVPEDRRIDMLSLMIKQSHGVDVKLASQNAPVEMTRYKEDSYYEENVAVGDSAVIFDIRKAVRNAEKR